MNLHKLLFPSKHREIEELKKQVKLDQEQIEKKLHQIGLLNTIVDEKVEAIRKYKDRIAEYVIDKTDLKQSIEASNTSKMEYYNKYTQLKKSLKMHIAKGVKAELTKLNKNKK